MICFHLTIFILILIKPIKTQSSYPKDFKRHVGLAPVTDWEAGLREAAYQALLKEHVALKHLRDKLNEAPLVGKQNKGITPFGDVAILARGQLYLSSRGFRFFQDPYQNDCIACHDLRECATSRECEIYVRNRYGERTLALWSVKRIRHRDPETRFELEYTVSPVRKQTLVTRNGGFNYAIPGHVFVVRTVVHNDKNNGPYNNHNKLVPNGWAPTGHYNRPIVPQVLPPPNVYLPIAPQRPPQRPPVVTSPTKSDDDEQRRKEIEAYYNLLNALKDKTSTTKVMASSSSTTMKVLPAPSTTMQMLSPGMEITKPFFRPIATKPAMSFSTTQVMKIPLPPLLPSSITMTVPFRQPVIKPMKLRPTIETEMKPFTQPVTKPMKFMGLPTIETPKPVLMAGTTPLVNGVIGFMQQSRPTMVTLPLTQKMPKISSPAIPTPTQSTISYLDHDRTTSSTTKDSTHSTTRKTTTTRKTPKTTKTAKPTFATTKSTTHLSSTQNATVEDQATKGTILGFPTRTTPQRFPITIPDLFFKPTKETTFFPEVSTKETTFDKPTKATTFFGIPTKETTFDRPTMATIKYPFTTHLTPLGMKTTRIVTRPTKYDYPTQQTMFLPTMHSSKPTGTITFTYGPPEFSTKPYGGTTTKKIYFTTTSDVMKGYTDPLTVLENAITTSMYGHPTIIGQTTGFTPQSTTGFVPSKPLPTIYIDPNHTGYPPKTTPTTPFTEEPPRFTPSRVDPTYPSLIIPTSIFTNIPQTTRPGKTSKATTPTTMKQSTTTQRYTPPNTPHNIQIPSKHPTANTPFVHTEDYNADFDVFPKDTVVTTTTIKPTTTTEKPEEFLSNANGYKPIKNKPTQATNIDIELFERLPSTTGMSATKVTPADSKEIKEVFETGTLRPKVPHDEKEFDDLFGGHRRLTTTPKTIAETAKIIYSDFFQASTSRTSTTSTTRSAYKNQIESQLTTTVPSTSQSFSTSVSVMVGGGGGNRRKPVGTKVVKKLRKKKPQKIDRELGESATTGQLMVTTPKIIPTAISTKAAFDDLALTLVNHARTIDYLEQGGKTKRSKYRRKNYGRVRKVKKRGENHQAGNKN